MKIFVFWGLLTVSYQLAVGQTVRYFEWIHQADSLTKLHRYGQAAECYDSAFTQAGGQIVVHDRYNAVCVYTLTGHDEKAFQALGELAQSPRFTDSRSLLADSDLVLLHDDPRWLPFLHAMAFKDSVAQTKINKPLKLELDSIFDSDQYYRRLVEDVHRKYGDNSPQMDSLEENMARADSQNLVRVSAILDKYGWLGFDVVGDKGSITLWGVVQHADEHPELQKKYLLLMRKAVADGVADKDFLAYLEDRVLVNESKPQLYGTQLVRNSQGIYEPKPIDDPAQVDIRRAAMGLEPLKYYLEESNPK
jgi:hypothetical protein